MCFIGPYFRVLLLEGDKLEDVVDDEKGLKLMSVLGTSDVGAYELLLLVSLLDHFVVGLTCLSCPPP